MARLIALAAIAVFAHRAIVNAQQERPPGERLAFEAATIKLAAPDAVRNRVMPSAPNRLNIPSMTQGRQLSGNIVVDQTGLKGRYTMDLDYLFAPPRPLDPAKPSEFAGPSLFTAVREQWGLRIVPGQGPFKAAVIESAQLPGAE